VVRLLHDAEHVRPDRRRIKPPRFHARDQVCGSCGFPLDETDAAASLPATSEGECRPSSRPATPEQRDKTFRARRATFERPPPAPVSLR
jgi:hypothetical protein